MKKETFSTRRRAAAATKSPAEAAKAGLFIGIEHILPPIAIAGQKALAQANGRMVECDVDRVQLHRLGLRRLWTWAYHVRINNVHVVRYGNENMIKAIPDGPVS